MRAPDQAKALLAAVRKAIRIPLTIKIRSGWDASGREALNIAGIAQDCGVDAIAVHPRTAGQQFRGRADWSIIAAVKKSVGIPVIGNGDIVSARDALKMLEETGCDAVMIGRKAIGNPAIFCRVIAGINGGEPAREDLSHRFDMMTHYFKASVDYIGEEVACRMMRSRLGWFTRGMRNSSKFRESIKHLSSEKEGIELIGAYRNSLLSELA
jgi:nifR3 family TIM-barrel protein